MGRERTNLLRAGRMALIPVALWGLAGCQTVKTPQEQIAKTNLPREKNMVSMPDYVVSPPDLITIEVLEALPGRPITGERLIRPDGTITLGFYGDLYVAGLTTTEIKEKIVIHLRQFLNDDTLGLIGKKLDPTDVNAEREQEFIIPPKGLRPGLRRHLVLQQPGLLRPGRHQPGRPLPDHRRHDGARRHPVRRGAGPDGRPE